MPRNQDQNNEFERSFQDVTEVIGNPPGWLLNSGISMVALVMVTLLIFTYFIKYPDTIQGWGVMTSSTPPIELVSRSNSYIEEIYSMDNEMVSEGDDILYLHNTTQPNEIEKIIQWIEKYESITGFNEILKLPFPENLQLGNMQGEYANLSLRIKELKQNLENNKITIQKIEILSEEINKIERLNDSKKREKSIYENELSLTRKKNRRNESLLESGSISITDLENSKMELLQKERLYETMNNEVIQNNIRIGQLKMEQFSLNNNQSERINSYKFSISESIARIRTNIEDWSQLNFIKAPISGKVRLKSEIREKKSIQIGQILGHVLPENSNGKFLSCLLPVANVGKVKEGQKVIVKFDAYPYKEFGQYLSVANEISDIPLEVGEGQLMYEVKVPLKDSLITDFGKRIPYQPEMTAQIEIITKDRSLFERIFDNLISILKTKT